MATDVTFVTNVDLSNNEIRNVKLQVLSADPTSGEAKFYYNSVSKAIRYHDGSAWRTLWKQDTTELAGTGLSAVDGDTIAVNFGAISGSPSFGQSNSNGAASTAARSDHTHALPAHDAGAHAAIKISDLASPTSSVSMGSQKITNLQDGTAATDAATVGQVQAAATGLDIKASARAATTANVGTYAATGGTSGRGQLTACPNTIDGVTLVANNRILVKNHGTAAANGIYVVTTVGTGANGVWDRATDFDSDSEVTPNAFVFVEEGTTNADTGWVLTTNGPITLGGSSGTSLAWTQFTGNGSIIAGAGLTQTGNQFDVGAGPGITVAADSVAIDTSVVTRKYAADLTGSATSYVVTHNLNTRDVQVTIRETGTPYGAVLTSWEATSVNTVTVYFATAPASGAYRAIVQG